MPGSQGKIVKLVDNTTVKPSPTEYPVLLPTLQTWCGMVLGNGDPAARPVPSQFERHSVDEAKRLYEKFQYRVCDIRPSWDGLPARLRSNLIACINPVTKEELIEYISHKKRIDVEQSVAMVVAYIRGVQDTEDFEVIESDELEDGTVPVLDELLNDTSVASMLTDTCMWREQGDRDLFDDPRDVARQSSWSSIISILAEIDPASSFQSHDQPRMITYLQRIRRRRSKLGHIQHLTFPDDILPVNIPLRDQWSWYQNYKTCSQVEIPISDPIIISKHRFRTLQRFLYHLGGPTDKTSLYVLEVERFTKSSGAIAPARLEALQASQDPYAIAYSFLTAQRHAQLKVVSDPQWKRFLVKGEGAMILQNRPDVLTSLEDILIRRATDLKALTAVKCPRGIRDNFSTETNLLTRTRKVCEFMERYVEDFGGGSMKTLVYDRQRGGGSGRGPVDVYNHLCDELRDCKARAKAMGIDMEIGRCYKFLAKDIMQWNDSWADDAFADGKIPGWVEYLARVRMQDIKVC